MGIPLYNIPDIRRFYGKDMYGTDPIDFFEEDYKPIDFARHCWHASQLKTLMKASSPHQAPLSASSFSLRSNVWGYFSVGANGGIHEFADSQFGHLFAKGPTRETRPQVPHPCVEGDRSAW
jgi:acetyl-CoA carboxylase/biotin carboxylase 1